MVGAELLVKIGGKFSIATNPMKTLLLVYRVHVCCISLELYLELGLPEVRTVEKESKGSVSQLTDDLDLINSAEQVELMVNSIQKGAENQKTSALVMLENLLGVFLICSTLFRSKSNLHEYAARLRGASMR